MPSTVDLLRYLVFLFLTFQQMCAVLINILNIFYVFYPVLYIETFCMLRCMLHQDHLLYSSPGTVMIINMDEIDEECSLHRRN